LKNIFYLAIIFTLIACTNKPQETKIEKVAEKTKTDAVKQVEKLVSNFMFTEGPAVAVNGNVYFTDIANNLIPVWTIENELDTFNTNSGGANGLYFDKDENLLACERELGQITSWSTEGKLTAIATEYNGNRFNQPNDVWPDGKGGVYFTDPFYGRDESELPQDGMHVYYVNPARTSVIRVIEDYEKPNGALGLLMVKHFT
jgi:gluconolactonase